MNAMATSWQATTLVQCISLKPCLSYPGTDGSGGGPDLPLDRLHEYQGRNPRPADFDAFWDRGLAELDALDPQVELIAHPLQTRFAECFHLRFTGVGGARVYAKSLRPRGATQPPPAALQGVDRGTRTPDVRFTRRVPSLESGANPSTTACRANPVVRVLLSV